MKKVADTHHLVRRNGVWYYRRRVPKELVAALGRTYIQHSLGTSQKKEATQRREIEDVKWSAHFAALLADQAGPPLASATPSLISKSELVDRVRRYVDEMDARFSARYAVEGPETEQQKRDMAVDIKVGISMLQTPDDPRGQERVFVAEQAILDGEPPTGAEGPSYAAFAELVRRALLELDRRRLARVSDDHASTFFDALFDPDRPPVPTFGEIASQFLEWRLTEAAANRVGQKFVDKITACVALVSEIVGPATPVTAVDFDIVQKVRGIVARTPANRTKIYGELPLKQAIERAEADGRPALSPVTQQSYLRALTDILDLAFKKRLIPSNPAEGVSPVKRETITPENKRRPFDAEQLAQFFTCAYYQKCARSGPQPFAYDEDGWRFWLPLISLFTGARPNEICQLEVHDIRQTDAGAWYFDIAIMSDDDADAGERRGVERKKLKTLYSRRKIPIHTQLVRMGILRFVMERRKAGQTRLFPTLKPSAAGYLSEYPMKRFRETFFPQAIKLKERQSFYSFRHNCRDALRAIEAPPDTLLALGAWSQARLTSDNYGTRANPDIQRKWIVSIGVQYCPRIGVQH